MSSIDDVELIEHAGSVVRAAPYIASGIISKFFIMKPGSDEVLHNVEGPWNSEHEAREAVRVRVISLIEDGKI